MLKESVKRVHQDGASGLRPLPDNRPAVPEPSKIDVSAFIRKNLVRYDGDGSFLADATEKTCKLWEKIQALQVEEIKQGGESNKGPVSLALLSCMLIDRMLPSRDSVLFPGICYRAS